MVDARVINTVGNYFRRGEHEVPSVFDLYVEEPPFGGEYVVTYGQHLLDLDQFKIPDLLINSLTAKVPDEKEFIEYLRAIHGRGREVTIHAPAPGTVLFRGSLLLRVEGPLGLLALLEPLLRKRMAGSCLNATNVFRFQQANPDTNLIDLSSQYIDDLEVATEISELACGYGFSGSSNTMVDDDQLTRPYLRHDYPPLDVERKGGILALPDGSTIDLLDEVLKQRLINNWSTSNLQELYSFVSYALLNPKTFCASITTHHPLLSGIFNYCLVAMKLKEHGFEIGGNFVVIEAGDIAHISKEVRHGLDEVGLEEISILAVGGITPTVLHSLQSQKHYVDNFGIGDALAYPASRVRLTYVPVEVGGVPVTTLPKEGGTIHPPGRKGVVRIATGPLPTAFIDYYYLEKSGFDMPKDDEDPIHCQHVANAKKQCHIRPSKWKYLLEPVWNADGNVFDGDETIPPLIHDRIRDDHLRTMNPTPYKLSVTPELKKMTDEFYDRHSPIMELR